MSYLWDTQIFNCYINWKDIFHSQNLFTISGHFVRKKKNKKKKSKSNDRLKEKKRMDTKYWLESILCVYVYHNWKIESEVHDDDGHVE